MTDYPVLTNLVLLQGSTFNPVLTAYDSNGNAVDWTGYQARMEARVTYDAGITLFALYSDPALQNSIGTNNVATTEANITISGTSIILNIAADQTTLLSFATAVYDIEMYLPNTNPIYVFRAIQGQIINNFQVTR